MFEIEKETALTSAVKMGGSETSQVNIGTD